MKRLVPLRVVLLLVIGAVLLAFDSPTSAHPTSVPRAAAACFFVGTCSTSGGVTTCTCVGTLAATAMALHAEEAASGEETLHCAGNLNGTPPSATTTCEGSNSVAPCILDAPNGAISGKHLVSTESWHEVITASGQVTLDCHFTP